MSLPEICIAVEMGLIYGIVSLGLFLTFRILDYSDLTVDGSFLTGAALSGTLLTKGMNPWLAIVFSMLTTSLFPFCLNRYVFIS